MASFTKTITNTFKVFGPDVTYLWNEFNWGTGYWGVDGDLDLSIGKLYSNSVSGSVALTFDVVHSLAAKTTTVGVALTFDVVHTLPAQTITGSDGFDDLSLTDAAGYEYIYPSKTANLATIASGTFDQVSIGSDAFTTFAATSTSWTLT
jgi:hypothetical protein